MSRTTHSERAALAPAPAPYALTLDARADIAAALARVRTLLSGVTPSGTCRAPFQLALAADALAGALEEAGLDAHTGRDCWTDKLSDMEIEAQQNLPAMPPGPWEEWTERENAEADEIDAARDRAVEAAASEFAARVCGWVALVVATELVA